MTTQSALASLDAWIANPGGNYGNGAGPRLQVGYADFSGTLGSNRVLLAIPLTGAGGALNGVGSPVTQALLELKVRGTNGCFGQGSGPRFWVEELTSAITENSENGECAVSGAGASTGRWPGPSSTTTNRVKYTGTPSAGTWISIDITAMVEAARLAGKAVLYLRLIAADASSGYDETSTARRIAFSSSEVAGSEPKLTVTWNANSAPNAPTVSPAGGDPTPTITNPGTSLTVTVTPSDPDAGDSMTGAKMEVYAPPAGQALATTQAQIDAGTLLPFKTVTWTQTAAPFPATKDLQATGLTGNAEYVYRCQTRDKGNGSSDQATWAWGAWCGLQRIVTNAVPGAIANLTVPTDTLTPGMTGALSDTDPGATINRVRLIVERPNGDGTFTTMLDSWFSGSGVTGGTSFLATYNGSPLNWGTQYRVTGQIEDNKGQAGPLLSSPIYWTPVQVLGPDNMSPRTTASKVNTRSPTLTIAHSSAFDQYELEVANAADGAGGLAADVGVTSIASTASAAIAWPGASPLPWAARPSWRAKVRITATANWTEWSPWFPFAVNALPETGVFYVKDQLGNWVLLSTLTAKIAASITPELKFEFTDPDEAAYGEVPKWRDIEIRKASDNSLVARVVRRMYAIEDETRAAWLHPFDQPGALTPTNSGWTAGTAAALSYDAAQKAVGTHSLKVALTSLATATVSTQAGPATVLGSLYTDLSGVTTMKVRTRCSALPAGAAVEIEFIFSGNNANYARFVVTPSGAAAWEQKTLTKASPSSSGGTVNWAQVSAINVRVSHAAGSNQSFDVWLDDLYADLYTSGQTYKLKGRYADPNTEDAWGAQSHADQYALLKTSTPPVVTQSGSISSSDPTPDIAWSVTGDQTFRRVLIEELPGYRDLVRYTPGCVAYWRFGETSGTTAVDQIAARNGTYTGGYTLNQPGALTPADPDPGVAFNGSTGYVTVPYAAALHPGNVWTIEGSIKRAANGTIQTLYSAGADDVEILLGASNDIQVWKQGTILVWRSAENVITDTNWHHLIVRRPGSRLLRVQLDGVDLAEATSSMVVAKDSFERTVSNGWGTSDLGGAWTIGAGSAGQYSVDGARAVLILPDNSTYRIALQSMAPVLDQEFSGSFSLSALPGANSANVYPLCRYVDASNHYRFRTGVVPSTGAVSVWIERVVMAGGTTLASNTLTGVVYTVGQRMRWRARVAGSYPTRLQYRLWVEGTAEPSTWLVDTTDSDMALQVAGRVGLTFYDQSVGSTLTWTFDDLAVADLAPDKVLAYDRFERWVGYAAVDSFNRSVADGWGSTDVVGSQAWTLVGTAGDFDVAGGVGTMIVPGNTSRRTEMRGLSLADTELLASVSADQLPVGGTLFLNLWSRHDGAADSRRYWVYAAVTSAGVIQAALSKRVASVDTTLATDSNLGTYTPNSRIRIRFRVQGTALSLKIWLDTAPEPSAWTLTATDSDVTAAGNPAFHVYAGGTATVSVSWDEITVRDLSTGGFGSPEVGAAWTQASSWRYSVGRGKASLEVAANGWNEFNIPLPSNDHEVLASLAPARVPTGGNIITGFQLRRNSANGDRYTCRIDLSTSGTISVGFERAGSAGYLYFGSVGTGLTFAAGTKIWVRARIAGSTLYAKVWLDGTTEPSTWTTTGSNTSYATGDSVGAWLNPAAGLTGGDFILDFDSYTVLDPNPTAFVANASAAINLGRRVTSNDRYLNGSLDEWALYSRSLTDAEQVSHYEARLRDTAPTEVIDTGEEATTATTYRVPAGLLGYAKAYRATVEVTNADGLTGSVVL